MRMFKRSQVREYLNRLRIDRLCGLTSMRISFAPGAGRAGVRVQKWAVALLKAPLWRTYLMLAWDALLWPSEHKVLEIADRVLRRQRQVLEYEMARMIRYEHHGTFVWSRMALKGKHRDHCLCFKQCAKFKPGEPDNCPIAQATFENCVKFGTTTPVFECPQYEAGPVKSA